MAFNFSGLRQNVRLSDFQDDWYGGNTNYAGDQQNNIKMSDLFTVPTTGGSSYVVGRSSVNFSHMGGIRYTSTAGATTSDPLPVLQAHMYGRYKATNTSAPSNQTLPQVQAGVTSGKGNAVNARLSDYVGLSDCVLTTDPCGETRGVKGGTTALAGHVDAAYFRKQAGVGNTAKGRNQDLNYSDIGYSVYRTYHNNSWSELGLNTVARQGDRILVIASSAGGDMYTHTTTQPLYLKNGTSYSSNVSVSTHFSPSKNQTGTDDNIAVYSATLGSGGVANRVGVNPFHSSTQYYLWHVFVIKGPNTTINRVRDRGKHTQQSFIVSRTNATSGQAEDTGGDAYGISTNTRQPFFIAVTTSPFTGNGFNSSAATSTANMAVDNVGFDMQFMSAIGTTQFMSYYTTICNFRGGTRSISFSSGKYSSWYGMFEGYNPQYGLATPRQDARKLEIIGSRGA